jgi:hypothetical protein
LHRNGLVEPFLPFPLLYLEFRQGRNRRDAAAYRDEATTRIVLLVLA